MLKAQILVVQTLPTTGLDNLRLSWGLSGPQSAGEMMKDRRTIIPFIVTEKKTKNVKRGILFTNLLQYASILRRIYETF